MLSLTILASSSAGNCALVRSKTTSVLIDAGIPRSTILQRLCAAGCDPGKLDGILVTHEHGDHVSGLQGLTARVGRPVYASTLTAAALKIEKWPFKPELRCFGDGTCIFGIGDLTIEAFPVPHDAVDPYAFKITCGKHSVAIVTDLGFISDEVRRHLIGCETILIEADHDRDLLSGGDRPEALKKRILGPLGHLSNEATCAFLRESIDDRTKTVILGHLSQGANSPARVLAAAQRAGPGYTTRLIVAPKDGMETINA